MYNVFVYATSPSDKSPYRQKIEAEAQHFVDVSAASTQQIVDRVVHDEIHILINLSGYTKGARNEVFAARPAPVQMSYMGFAGTLSAGWCDYFIVGTSRLTSTVSRAADPSLDSQIPSSALPRSSPATNGASPPVLVEETNLTRFKERTNLPTSREIPIPRLLERTLSTPRSVGWTSARSLPTYAHKLELQSCICPTPTLSPTINRHGARILSSVLRQARCRSAMMDRPPEHGLSKKTSDGRCASRSSPTFATTPSSLPTGTSSTR